MARKEKETQKINWSILAGVTIILSFILWLWKDISKLISKYFAKYESIKGNGIEKDSEFSDNLMTHIAERLHNAMNRIGKDETDLNHILNEALQTPADFEKAYVFFGKRSYNIYRGGESLINIHSKNLNLVEWLIHEYSNETDKINAWRIKFNGSSFM